MTAASVPNAVTASVMMPEPSNAGVTVVSLIFLINVPLPSEEQSHCTNKEAQKGSRYYHVDKCFLHVVIVS